MSDASEPSKSNQRNGLILLCAILLTAGYYLVHTPVPPEAAIAICLAIWRILLAALIVSLAGAIGRGMGFNLSDNRLASVVIQSGLGLGILAAGILLAGSIAGVNWITLGIVPLAVIVLLRRHWLAWWRDLVDSMRTAWRKTGRDACTPRKPQQKGKRLLPTSGCCDGFLR